MAKQNSRNGLSLAELHKLRAEVEERTSHIPRGDRFQIGQIIKFVEELGGYQIKEHQLRNLQKMQLLRPDQDDRRYYRYSREDLRDLLLICKLHQEFKIQYAQVGGLLLAEARDKLVEWVKSPRTLDLSATRSQVERGHFFWRSHLLEVLLAWLFDGTVPRFAGVLVREQDFPIQSGGSDEAWMEIRKCEFLDVDNILSDVGGSDLVVITTGDREVLHKHIGWEDWKQYHNLGFNWYHLQGSMPQSSTSYQVVIGVPNSSAARGIQSIPDSRVVSLFLNLLAACFLEAFDVSPQADAFADSSTQLQVIVNLIPDLSPYWQYSAVLVPNPLEPERLIPAAASQDFSSKVRLNMQVPCGQLLSGWAYQKNQYLVVQRTIGEEDPRIAYRLEEKAMAAAAISTLANGKPNGVLYVGTRELSKGEVFTETEVLLLRILGRIVGELIEIEHTRLRTRQAALEITRESPPRIEPWEKLQEDIDQVVDDLMLDKLAQQSQDNLHLMAICISNYDALQERSVEIAEWAAAQTRLMAYHYYLDQELGVPVLYDRAPDKFMLLLKRVPMDDKEERDLRDKLRAHLNSMSLSFEWGKPPLVVQCDLWSLPFRYSNLALRVDQSGSEKVVRDCVRDAEHTFHTLSFIHRAHQYEEKGAWEKALELYERAYAFDPENIYIWRHIAKTRTQMYDYEGAVRWWGRVINAHKHPSHYRRLAYNLACLGDLDHAVEMCEEALKLDDQDAKCYAQWGDILCQLKNYEEAIEKYQKAALFDPDNRATYLLRIAEARFNLDQYRDALNACTQALTYETNNPDVPFWMMKISQAMRPSKDGL